jgi:uncharacterized phosphosugar-binding protein
VTARTPAEAVASYLEQAEDIVRRVRDTQTGAILAAAAICATSIAEGSLVHLFGTGHSRMLVEEMYPRYGSFPGFHPVVELSMTYHTDVVGTNGQRQAMFIERTEGLAEVILSNFELDPSDAMVVFSSTGVNAVPVEMALGAKARGLTVIAVVTLAYAREAAAKHSSGKRLIDLADVVLDNCSLPGDAMVSIEGLETPVAPGSTIGGAAIVNALKAAVAAELTARGQPPIVITSERFVGPERSRELFEASYRDYRRRVRRL